MTGTTSRAWAIVVSLLRSRGPRDLALTADGPDGGPRGRGRFPGARRDAGCGQGLRPGGWSRGHVDGVTVAAGPSVGSFRCLGPGAPPRALWPASPGVSEGRPAPGRPVELYAAGRAVVKPSNHKMLWLRWRIASQDVGFGRFVRRCHARALLVHARGRVVHTGATVVHSACGAAVHGAAAGCPQNGRSIVDRRPPAFRARGSVAPAPARTPALLIHPPDGWYRRAGPGTWSCHPLTVGAAGLATGAPSRSATSRTGTRAGRAAGSAQAPTWRVPDQLRRPGEGRPGPPDPVDLRKSAGCTRPGAWMTGTTGPRSLPRGARSQPAIDRPSAGSAAPQHRAVSRDPPPVRAALRDEQPARDHVAVPSPAPPRSAPPAAPSGPASRRVSWTSTSSVLSSMTSSVRVAACQARMSIAPRSP